MSSQQQPQRRTGGPIGGLVKLIGTGVGAAVEYHGHRKQRKAAHDSAQASPTEDTVIAGPSQQPPAIQRSISDSLPTYSQSTQSDQDRQLATGPPAGDEKKRTSLDSDSDSSQYLSDDDLTPTEDDEEAWQLDDLAAATEPPSYEETTREDTDAFINDVAAARTASTNNTTNPKPLGTLPLPVIIPQRRPRNKSRGFVRAYSPVLENVNIDKKTFLRFLKNFHTSSQANPIFDAIQIAAGIAGFVPEPITMAVTMSLQIAAGIGKEVDSRRKTNNFLDRMNDEFFKPAGCFAFIMKYKSDAEVASASSGNGLLAKLGMSSAPVDFSASSAIAKYDAASEEGGGSSSKNNKFAAQMKKMRLVSGETRGSVKMLEAAPLVYPEIDEVVYSGANGEETFKDKTRDAKKFLTGYVDRRAQMGYAQKDPSSALIIPESSRQNKSKWSDPNHPMFNGGLVGLVSGGYIDAEKYRAEKRERKHERKEERKDRRFERKTRRSERRYGSPRGGVVSPDAQAAEQQQQQGPDYFNRGTTARRAYPREKRGVIGAVKKVMQQDVLYLMIVPMPSEAELAEARQMLAMEKERN